MVYGGKMFLKPTRYYATDYNKRGELLLMSTLSKTYLKFSPEIAEKVLTCLKSDHLVEYDEETAPLYEKILYNNGFLYESDYDESKFVDVIHKTHLFSDNWLYLTILPTNNCNFRCVYCYETNKDEYMSEQTENNILEFVRKNIRKYKYLRLNWFGGEPLLKKERVIYMSEKISAICRENKVPMIGLMSTNGYELDVETFKKLIRSRILSYQICLDGDVCTHNIQRPHYLNSDSYETIFNNLKSIKENVKSGTFKIGIRANMTPFVEEHMQSHLEKLATVFGGDSRFNVYFQGVRDWGGERIKTNKPELVDNEEVYYRKWYDIASVLGLNSAESLEFAPVYGLCEANLKNGYVITYDGKITKCSLASYNERYKDVNEIGYIDEKGKAIIDEAKQAKWIASRVTSHSCYNCYIYPICCGGSCPYMKNIQGKNSCLPIKEMIKAHLRCMDSKGKIEKTI